MKAWTTDDGGYPPTPQAVIATGDLDPRACGSLNGFPDTDATAISRK